MASDNAPGIKHAAITPSDTVDIAGGPCRAIYVGGAGVVAVVDQFGTLVNYTAPAGTYLFICAKRVNLTNTTATLMVALF